MKLKTIVFPLTGFAEMVWDIGTKVAAARLKTLRFTGGSIV